ncbi:hypothetical protein IV203_027018 [Nitzschia inconspicua]|uniref:Uncharacterized protein n=1 Tax=Nitzschia inconspicua TaxID=303405 RepID=A0A9K3PXQ9_9STRA|nr:hypothetical protein IV203_027018 [Nitzschia inconspicua]
MYNGLVNTTNAMLFATILAGGSNFKLTLWPYKQQAATVSASETLTHSLSSQPGEQANDATLFHPLCSLTPTYITIATILAGESNEGLFLSSSIPPTICHRFRIRDVAPPSSLPTKGPSK